MAISKVKVNGKVNDGFRTEIGCSHNFIIDQPKAMGGNDEGANPMEIFLASLPACICAIGRIIANQKRLDVRSIDVDVEGSIDKDEELDVFVEDEKAFSGKAYVKNRKKAILVESVMQEKESLR